MSQFEPVVSLNYPFRSYQLLRIFAIWVVEMIERAGIMWQGSEGTTV